MRGVDAIRNALQSTQQLTKWFLADLTDDDLLLRPVPGANHIAWQLGHVIFADRMLISEEIPDAGFPDLPAGFLEQHSKETATQEPPKGFLTKAQYIDLFDQIRNHLITVLDRLTDADLDRPTTGRMKDFAPKLGSLFLLVSNHALMHAGQFSVVRRKLGKPVLF